MTIIRAPRPVGGYTVISNAVLRDDRLSYRARGVLAVILSRPDNWRTDAMGLMRDGTEGREAIRSALRELEGAGYIARHRLQDERGRWRQVAMVYDAPMPVQEQLDLAANQDGFPAPGIPASGEPTAGFLGPIRSTEKKYLEEELPSSAKANGKPSTVDPAVTEAVRLVMEGKGPLTVDAAKVHGIVKRLRVLVPSAEPARVSAAYLALRARGVTNPNAEKVGDEIAKAGPSDYRNVNGDHWASGGDFAQEGAR